MISSKIKGDLYESRATKYLEQNNYKILRRNYICEYGEIDIICEKDEYIIFVEVKYRRNLTLGYPRESVNKKKQHRIKKASLNYISTNNIDNYNFRYDVIEYLDEYFEHLENAFQ